MVYFMIFWFLTPCFIGDNYQRFEGTSCSNLRMETENPPKIW